MTDAEKVVAHINSLPDWEYVTPTPPYGHIGATLIDAVLQSGVRYDKVVLPRVNLVRKMPLAKTTSSFANLLEREGAESLLKFKGKKIVRLKALIALLQSNGIETEEQLRVWLEVSDNLNRLHEIKGIKDKTADYLQILVGVQGVAVDRHLFRFLEQAGVSKDNYMKAWNVISETSALLGIEPVLLDHSIWRYMSNRSRVINKPLCSKS